jgi:dephospho-CoA kinase
MSFVVGLTGGIGSGKSAAADCFAALGAAIVDTDAIAHALTGPAGAALPQLGDAFGPAIFAPDGSLDRAALRRLVFADPAMRARLEGILHPLIRAEAEAQVRRTASADLPYVVLVVPLLAETGSYRERIDRVAVVDCPEETQIARVVARSGLRREEVAAIMAAQATRAMRLAIADDVIDNTAGLAELRARIAALHDQYMKMAALRHGNRFETHD